MPAMYEQTLFMDSTELWNPTLYIPDVVCVNLGTNDTSLDNYDMNLLTDGYRSFMKKLRIYYPYAKIVLLTGAMLNGKQLEDVKNQWIQSLKKESLKGIRKFIDLICLLKQAHWE